MSSSSIRCQHRASPSHLRILAMLPRFRPDCRRRRPSEIGPTAAPSHLPRRRPCRSPASPAPRTSPSALARPSCTPRTSPSRGTTPDPSGRSPCDSAARFPWVPPATKARLRCRYHFRHPRRRASLPRIGPASPRPRRRRYLPVGMPRCRSRRGRRDRGRRPGRRHRCHRCRCRRGRRFHSSLTTMTTTGAAEGRPRATSSSRLRRRAKPSPRSAPSQSRTLNHCRPRPIPTDR
mmetsp:Transcript_32837/g.60495  ORF Transcript_32837/g.60495 Transcript_32837/m.60495 type:complete len:234 (-) Transcript_32837:780-1481(-)